MTIDKIISEAFICVAGTDFKPTKKIKMSQIQKRIIRELHAGTKLSVRNQYKIKCSNIGREIVRQFEIPFGIILDRECITWIDEYGHGWYFDYSLNPKDRESFMEVYNKVILNVPTN